MLASLTSTVFMGDNCPQLLSKLQKNAMRISDESHEFTLDEIRRRERLECDPSRVFVAADEDSESDEDDED